MQVKIPKKSSCSDVDILSTSEHLYLKQTRFNSFKFKNTTRTRNTQSCYWLSHSCAHPSSSLGLHSSIRLAIIPVTWPTQCHFRVAIYSIASPTPNLERCCFVKKCPLHRLLSFSDVPHCSLCHGRRFCFITHEIHTD